MTSSALVTPCWVTVRGLAGVSRVNGWRLGDWVVHRQLHEPQRFCLTLLPLALSLPLTWASFRSRHDAIGAMGEIVRLKNSWSVTTQADLTKQLEAALRRICARHGAFQTGDVQPTCEAGRSLLGAPTAQRFNGYPAVN